LNHRFTLEPDAALELNLKLHHHKGYITFNTRPDGAQVYVNNPETREFIGETPLDAAHLDTGSYTFEVILENYHPIQGELFIEGGQYYTEKHTLEPYVSKLQVFSRPTGGQLWINDEKRPEVTPANIQLPPGEYSIGVYKSGFMMNEQTIELEPNGSYTINAVLEEGNMPIGMVLVAEGEFIYGDNNKSPDEKPLRKIRLDAFYIDKNEVTNAEFAEVFPGHVFEDRRGRYPATGVTWKQAADYATAVGKRLPTEMEWEKAARGAKGKEYPWGAVFKKEFANAANEISSDLQPVGNAKKGVSEYGCYDMAGNAYEWVSDWYNPYPGNPEVTIEYGSIYRVLRGGSYRSDLYEVRGAKRHYDKPDAQRNDYGFRCAQDVSE
jgi:formylglycine-generating enzyme required for sulfatase activity